MDRDGVPGLDAWGYDERARGALSIVEAEGRPARVVRAAGGGVCFAATADGVAMVSAAGTRSQQAGVGEWPATGDWVVIDEGAVVGVAPRWSRLARLDPADPRREQVLAANVDVVLCVQGLDRPLSPERLERLAALAWDGGATPVAVLTKSDLADDPDAAARAVSETLFAIDVVVTSVATGRGLDELAARARGNTVALLGPSGAGKSTLVNALVGEEIRAIGAVREGDAKGRHVTTARELVRLPTGGVLVDTPGLRAVGLGDAIEGVAAAFADIEELAVACRFRDCRHEQEPGCAVRAAVEAGDLAPQRLERYVRLRLEVERAEIRAGPVRSRAEHRRFGRMIRDIPSRE
jgi:ribosome biogenesis GTPase